MPAVVLIVDDDPSIRESVALLLADEGYRVHTARDGREALALLADPPPTDVVLSDVMMPLVDGYELVEEMRAKGNLTPVILMSAGTTPACDLPHVHCLTKPFDAAALLALIAEVLNQP